MTDQSLLLDHYLARGRESWNVSLEASWLDYVLRSYVQPRIMVLRNAAPLRSLAVCNIGIGVGLWDDWLGHLVGARITSVDRDEEICRTFAVRQAHEGHPYPAHVICGDALDGALGVAKFDVITIVGSTLEEMFGAQKGSDPIPEKKGSDPISMLRAQKGSDPIPEKKGSDPISGVAHMLRAKKGSDPISVFGPHLADGGVLLTCDVRATSRGVAVVCNSTAEATPTVFSL